MAGDAALVGLGIGIGVAGTLGTILLLARSSGGDPGREAAVSAVYECRACHEYPLRGDAEAREHAVGHSSIDEKNWREVVMEVA